MALRFSGVILLGVMGATALRADSVLAGSVAVLPFTHAGGTPIAVAEWLGESIAESLREALLSKGSPVISREDAAAAYTDLKLRPNAELTQASVLKLGQAMNADKAIHGTFRMEGGTLIVEAIVSDLGRSRLSAPLRETATLLELDRLQAHLAWQAIAVVNPMLAVPETNFRTLRPYVRTNAEEQFIRGLMGAAEQREKLYREANKADPKFARPLLELGKIELARKGYKAAAEWLQKVEPGDLHYPEASFYFGVAKFHSGDYVAAQSAFQRITASLPAAEVFNNLGVAESRRNQLHALASFREALDLNPNHPDYRFNMGFILFKTGQYEAAADRFREVLERDPMDQMATLLLGRSLKGEALRKGNPADVRFEEAERFKDTYEEPFYRAPVRPSAERSANR